MWKRISIFILGLLLPEVIFAASQRLEIRLVKNNEIVLDPGSSFCVAVMLSNYTGKNQEFHLKINAPEGWNQLMDYSSVEVGAATKQLQILSFYAPDNAKVGDYNIYIDAYDKSGNMKIGSVKVPVYVKPKYGLLTKTMNPPVFVFAGDTLSVKFLLENLSNVRTTFKTTVTNNRVSETRNITLEADASQIIRIFITTKKDLSRYTTNTVSVSASVLGAPKINSTSSCIFKVIPSEKVKFDAYNRIPVSVSGLFATNNPSGVRNYGYMYNIQGGGLIRPGKQKRIYFDFRGPNRMGNPVLGQTDQYYVRYNTGHSKIIIGDNNFGLTPLTEGSRLGRGVSFQHNFKHLTLGGFVNFPRFYPGLKRVISANGGYFSGQKFKLNLGFLNKVFVNDSAVQLLSVSGKLNPFSWNSINFEVAEGSAKGKMRKAYSVNFKINHKILHLFADYTRADHNFPGYVSNTEFVSSGVSVAFFKKLDLSANYYFNHTNMALDTMYANAPFSKNILFSLGYNFSINSSISVSASKMTMEDMSVKKQFYYDQNTVRLALNDRIKRISINLYGAYGKTINYLKPVNDELATKTTMNANLSIQYKISNSLDLASFVNYLGAEQFINSQSKRFLYGGTANVHLGGKFRMSLQYQNSYAVEQLYQNRSLLGLTAHYRLSKHDNIGAFVYYGKKSNQLKQTQLSATLNFTHIFNFPSSKRKDVGNLYGKIINDGVNTVKGLRVTMDGNITYTDQNGNFNFQNVRTGTHYLFVVYSDAGYNAIATKPGPYKINILPGKSINFEVALTVAGEIKGKLDIKKNKNLTNKGYITAKNEMKQLIIEVSNGNEIFTAYTKKDGTFDFTDLRPGPWKVKVYSKGIPEGYQLVTNEFDVNLASKQVKFINVVIKKIYHKIQFQQSSW